MVVTGFIDFDLSEVNIRLWMSATATEFYPKAVTKRMRNGWKYSVEFHWL